MLSNTQVEFLNIVCKCKWIHENNTISTIGNVDMSNMNLTKIPVQFGRVYGNFNCNANVLTNLHGAPFRVDGYFNCSSNQLTSLKGGPRNIVDSYSCGKNLLTSLIGAPEKCNYFWCDQNKLTSLEGCPSLIEGDLLCDNVSILYGIGCVNGFIYYNNLNDLNEWIIQQARSNIFLSYLDIANWIKQNNRLNFLTNAQPEILCHFSEYIIKIPELKLC